MSGPMVLLAIRILYKAHPVKCKLRNYFPCEMTVVSVLDI